MVRYNTQDLNPLQGTTYPVGASIPADTPAGRYFICARIDPRDTVAESNEENNVACVPIKIKKKASQNLAAVAPLFTAR